MTSHARALAERLSADLRTIVAGRVRAVVVYGAHAGAHATSELPVHVVAVVHELGIADLEALAPMAPAWRRAGLATPLLLDDTEFVRSLDAFPIEFGAILAQYEVHVGADPFAGLRVDPLDLRRACEVQVRSHLLHLREGYLETGGRPDAIRALVTTSAGPLHTLLVNLSTLDGTPERDPDALAALAARWTGAPAAAFGDVLALDAAPGIAGDPARVFPRYLDAVERLAAYVDRPEPAR